jgi:putative addiction module component (TIGR02574 family)
MSVTAQSLGIDKLDGANRLALNGELWDSVSYETESLPLSAEPKAELIRRIEDADLNPDTSVPWDEVKGATIARLRKSIETPFNCG